MEKKHENKNDITSSHVHASREYVSSRFMLFPKQIAKYIRHIRDIGHTGQFMCPISHMCLMFYKFKLQNIFGQDKKHNKEVKVFLFHVFFTFYVISNIF